MNQDDCVADFNFRFNTRLPHRVACSLEYQHINKIVIETLLQWDIKKTEIKRERCNRNHACIYKGVKNRVVEHYMGIGRYILKS